MNNLTEQVEVHFFLFLLFLNGGSRGGGSAASGGTSGGGGSATRATGEGEHLLDVLTFEALGEEGRDIGGDVSTGGLQDLGEGVSGDLSLIIVENEGRVDAGEFLFFVFFNFFVLWNEIFMFFCEKI